MHRLRAMRCRLAAASAMLLFLLSLTYLIPSLSARPVTSSEISLDSHAIAGHGEQQLRASSLSSTPRPRIGHLSSDSSTLDIATLQRGEVYAVNVHGGSFKLSRVDLAQLLSAHDGRPSAASLTTALRAAHPGENVGWAWFADTYREDGWYRLEIRIDQDAPFPDVVKARAAGFVEGNLQGPHMHRYWTNYRVNEYRGRGEAPSQELYDFFDEQYGWMMRRVERATGWDLATLRPGDNPLETASGAEEDEHEHEDGSTGGGPLGSSSSSSDARYWELVGLVAAQFEGLAAGFWASVADPERNMTWHELYALNALGDMYELNVLFPPHEPLPPTPPTAPAEAEAEADAAAGAAGADVVRQRHYTPGHGEVGEYGYGELLDCSAIIKIDTRSDADAEDEGDDGDDGVAAGDGDGEGGSGLDLGRRGAAARRPSERQRERVGGAGGAAAAAAAGGPGLGQQRLRRERNFWASHNTWRSYYEMVRTWKVYDLPWARSGPVTVSSSPGLLHSKDDWYTTDQFVVMETTNGIYNKKLYDEIQPKCVLMWQRVQVANFGAREGSEWVDLFARHNSGTYNNQWMVLDVDQLQQPRPRSDVLWVLEQLPGLTMSKDVTRVLMEQGYWASYNVPYFPEIYNLTGYPQPSIYATCPRARIFSREQSRLSSRSDVMALMRLNHYRDDPLSLGLPNNAIAARYDLPGAPDESGTPRNWTKRAYGAVDAKVVDLESFRTRRTYVINGPTAEDLPVFRWSAEPLFDAIRREGCVDEFDFGWRAYESVVGPPMAPRRQSGGVQRRRDAGAGPGGAAEAGTDAADVV